MDSLFQRSGGTGRAAAALLALLLAAGMAGCGREETPEPAAPDAAETADEAVARIRETAEIVVAEAMRKASETAMAVARSEKDPTERPYPRPEGDEISAMTFNLNQYRLVVRDDSGELEPKPKEEAARIIAVIRSVAPDVLLVQEMGDPAAWAEFKYALRQAGLSYTAEEYLQRGRQDLNLALLSRLPIVERNSHVDGKYSIGPAQFPILRGVLDVTVEAEGGYRLRVMGVHLKSKVFHSFGQTEMRRAESRLVGGYVRDVLDADAEANLLVMGDFNDEPGTLPLREVSTYKRRPLLFDLRPLDYAGDAWTHTMGNDVYHRIDYALASKGLLPEIDLEKTYVVRSPLLEKATDHRPLVVTLHAAERPAEMAPDLEARRPIPILEND